MLTERVALTTTDNMYNPFTEFDKWYRFDEDNGYHTSSYVARLCELLGFQPYTFDDETEEENELIKEQAIEYILKYDPNKTYVRVTEPVYA